MIYSNNQSETNALIRGDNCAWQVEVGNFIPGFAYGLNNPSLAVLLQGNVVTPAERAFLFEKLSAYCPSLKLLNLEVETTGISEWHATVEWLLSIFSGIQREVNLPVFDRGITLALDEGTATCLIPTTLLSAGHLAPAMTHLVNWLVKAIESKESAYAELQSTLDVLALAAPKGSNVYSFAQAAHTLDIPAFELPGGIMQYGMGARARWLDSSYTDETSIIGAKFARNKVWAASLLRQAGLPAPFHVIVFSEKEALIAARDIGYPVVVKPINLDGGLGVSAGLRTEAEVTSAYSAALKHSNQIMLEKHFYGRDYRLQVVQGALAWALEREPAGVRGDGCLTVGELIQKTNSDPRRGAGSHSPLKLLVIDAEASDLLANQGVGVDTVIAHGEFIRLRRIANISTGGMPIAVFESVHPDNAKLAVRAAQILRLDIAGVDLIIPDIRKSWLESGAVICEVNSQPQFGKTTAMHIYPQILKKLVPGSGKIPIILMLNPAKTVMAETLLILRNKGYCVGSADELGVYIGCEKVANNKSDLIDSGRALLLDTRVEAIVLAVTESSLLRTGLPFKEYDALVISDITRDMPLALARMLLPACKGNVFDTQNLSMKSPELIGFTSAQWVKTGLARLELGNIIALALSGFLAEELPNPGD